MLLRKDYTVFMGRLSHRGRSYRLKNATGAAIIEHSVDESTSLGRVVAGSVLAGPLGGVVGAMAKKRTVEVRIWFKDGRVITVDVDRKRMNDAHALVFYINRRALK